MVDYILDPPLPPTPYPNRPAGIDDPASDMDVSWVSFDRPTCLTLLSTFGVVSEEAPPSRTTSFSRKQIITCKEQGEKGTKAERDKDGLIHVMYKGDRTNTTQHNITQRKIRIRVRVRVRFGARQG
jgi:hypothetical protein